jgi:hypothetical protein
MEEKKDRRTSRAASEPDLPSEVIMFNPINRRLLATVAAGGLLPLVTAAPGTAHATTATTPAASVGVQSSRTPQVPATAQKSFPVHRGRGVPRCISIWERAGLTTRTAYAKNKCRKSHKIKFVWTGAKDSSCVKLRPRKTASSKRNKFVTRAVYINRC